MTTAYFSEFFISLEGEGPLTGVPTVYMRFGGCNLRCPGFNNAENKPVLDFNPLDYKSIHDIPLITRGCDSNYSVDKKLFKHMWMKLTPHDALSEVKKLLPNNSWQSKFGTNYILSITGGEPLLYQDFLCEFLQLAAIDGCKTFLFETNGSINITNNLFHTCYNLQHSIEYADKSVIWSNSPKLSISGETFDKAINVDCIKQQYAMNTLSYFKFVTNGDDKYIDEINDLIAHYVSNNLSERFIRENVYLMPMACTQEQQNEVAQIVANQCIQHGFKFSYRLQNSLWGNGVGT